MNVEVRKDEAARSVEATVTIDAPPEAVWKALTDAQELVRWFPTESRVKPGPGGEIFISWRGGWESANRIEIWEPNRRLKTSWSETFSPDDVKTGALHALAVDYHLSAAPGGGTILRLVHSGFGRGAGWDHIFSGVNRGWTFELRSLKHYLERHRGRDRAVAWVRTPLRRGTAGAFAAVASDAGLGLGDTSRMSPGDVFRARTASGDVLEGRAVHTSTPGMFLAIISSLNDALLRLEIEESCGTPSGAPEAWVWLSTYGIDPGEIAALEKRWEKMVSAAVTQVCAAAAG